MHWPSPPSNNGQYGKPHAPQDRHRRESPGTTPSRGPERGRRGANSAPLRRRGPAAGTMSPVLCRPPRAPRSHRVKPGAQPPVLGKGTTASDKRAGGPRANGPEEARRTARGHEARQRGTLPATSKAHGQVPGNNGCRVPQTRRAHTTRKEPRHENRCQGGPTGRMVWTVWTDVCAPGSGSSPCQLRNSRRPDGRVRAQRVRSPCQLQTPAIRRDECAPGSVPSPCRLQNSRCPDGRVHAWRLPSPCRLRTAAVRNDDCAPRSNAPHTQHRTNNTQHITPSEHTGEQEPSGPGHRTRNTTHTAGTPVNRSQVAQDTVVATKHTKRAQR